MPPKPYFCAIFQFFGSFFSYFLGEAKTNVFLFFRFWAGGPKTPGGRQGRNSMVHICKVDFVQCLCLVTVSLVILTSSARRVQSLVRTSSQERKRHINMNFLVRLVLGRPGVVPGTNRAFPWDKPTLSQGQTQVFSWCYAMEAQFVPRAKGGRKVYGVKRLCAFCAR